MAIYILKRKYFSTQLTKERNQVLSKTKTSIQEIFKLTFLAYSCSNNIDHWLNHLSDSLTKSGDPLKVFLGIVDNYKNLPRQFNESYVKELRNNKPVDRYLRDLFDDLRKQKDDYENIKYGDLLPKTLTNDDIKDLIQKLKYITLCLSGQLNPEHSNWWDKEVATTQVNWDTGKGMKIKDDYLRKIIENII